MADSPPPNLGRLRVESDKCDWRLATPGLEIRGRQAGVADDIRADVVGGRIRIDSDKCDWRLAAPAVDIAGTEGVAQDVRAQFARGRLRADSDKCDFRLQLTEVERLTQADVSAREVDVRASGASLRADVT